MTDAVRLRGRFFIHSPTIIAPSRPVRENQGVGTMTHIRLGDAAEAVVAFLAAVGALKLVPHFKAKMALVRERDAAIAEAVASKAQLIIAEGTVQTLRDNAEGWREAMERVTGDVERMTSEITELRSEMRTTSAELVDVKHRFSIAVQYIAELIHRGSAPVPPIPEALREQIEAVQP